MSFKDELMQLNACQDAIDWVSDRTREQAWNECKDGSWLLWYAAKTELCSRQILVLAGCDCAERALKYVPEGENRPAEAIRIARLWADGKAAIEEVRAATYTTYATYAGYAGYASNATAYAAYVAYVAANAAYAAYAAANASGVKRTEELKIMADIVRKRIKL